MSTPKPGNFWKWFHPRGRDASGWAFILNRITAIGLTVYLYLHLVALGKLADGPQAFDSFVAWARNPVVMAGEWLVVAAGFYHGLNGLRLALTGLGIAVRYQKAMLVLVVVVTLLAALLFALRMFTA